MSNRQGSPCPSLYQPSRSFEKDGLILDGFDLIFMKGGLFVTLSVRSRVVRK